MTKVVFRDGDDDFKPVQQMVYDRGGASGGLKLYWGGDEPLYVHSGVVGKEPSLRFNAVLVNPPDPSVNVLTLGRFPISSQLEPTLPSRNIPSDATGEVLRDAIDPFIDSAYGDEVGNINLIRFLLASVGGDANAMVGWIYVPDDGHRPLVYSTTGRIVRAVGQPLDSLEMKSGNWYLGDESSPINQAIPSNVHTGWRIAGEGVSGVPDRLRKDGSCTVTLETGTLPPGVSLSAPTTMGSLAYRAYKVRPYVIDSPGSPFDGTTSTRGRAVGPQVRGYPGLVGAPAVDGTWPGIRLRVTDEDGGYEISEPFTVSTSETDPSPPAPVIQTGLFKLRTAA